MVGPQEGIKFHLRYKLMYFYVILFFLYLHLEILGVFVFEFSGSLGLRVVFVFETPNKESLQATKSSGVAHFSMTHLNRREGVMFFFF